MQIVSIGDNLLEVSNPVSWKNKKNLHEVSNRVLGEKQEKKLHGDKSCFLGKRRKYYQSVICRISPESSKG